jgi:hypothetical protein
LISILYFVDAFRFTDVWDDKHMVFLENSPSFANLNGKECLQQSGVYNTKHKARDDGRTSVKEILSARK